MVFSSSIFIFVFLPLVLFLYYISGKKLKNYVLLLASLFFYSWGGVSYLKILIVSIIINYIFGILIDDVRSNIKLRKIFLRLGIILNLALLFYYKYYDFTIENINEIFNTNYSIKNIVLPIGISFFTFQGMSYIIDIYRNDGKVNKNPFSVALYISLFPQLVAGPIIKYKTIDDQIRNRKESLEFFSYGINRFVIGLAKKVIIADILAGMADNIFNLYYSGIDMPTAWIGAICYTFQIYYDFSGYSDMAIGLGYMFGFEFMENFNYPYISKSITEFWRRWHISLSTWFKEYLYIPLGGNRRGNIYFNLFVVFLVTGIWHGAAWTFILWGLWHGFFILIERAIRNKEWYINVPRTIKYIVTMLIVILGWVLFRADNLEQAIGFIKTMFGFSKAIDITFEYSYFINKKLVFWIVISILGAVPFANNNLKKYKKSKNFEVLSTIIISLLFIISIIFVVNSTYSPFIYFQF
ncbi:MAG: MBOAT family protein [Clostridium sp.]|mgnify:FL=1|uniref:MBOAT family O-acyltransferase n=2 Tax=unclassified Clostridium TaxID=2614128 RepID=UPI0025D2F8F3|nr:MBOAT family O-acyltransferase [Clostridium sp.]MCI6690977.1 MBOAT family protein [Clostridium sp.]MDY2632086.1 MBOAT family O-acyltransferase [Clostridium sp.]MDY4252171.1 MBOAT family O-acyltransferase [Clostridium sp.]